jgi:hypothetical protein
MAIWYSIKMFEGATHIFHGLMTDSGGGGILHSLQHEMAKLHLCAQIYFVAPCMMLHAMNLKVLLIQSNLYFVKVA